MKGKPIQNLAASVYARLLKRAEPGDEQFQFVLMRYGAERLMYRLSQSEHAANFVLKGAMMFLVWTGAQYRATKDMDLLALKSSSVERLRHIFRELCEDYETCAEAIVPMLNAAGIRAKLQTPEWATLWANVQQGKVPFYYMGRGGIIDADFALALQSTPIKFLSTGPLPPQPSQPIFLYMVNWPLSLA